MPTLTQYNLTVTAETINMMTHSLYDIAIITSDSLRYLEGTDGAEAQAELNRIQKVLNDIHGQCRDLIRHNRNEMAGPLSGERLRQLVADNDQLSAAMTHCSPPIS